MATNSNVSIIGNLTRDPELRFTPSGQATATFGVAVNRSWQNRQTQEWQEQTSFFDVVCWAGLAENAAQSLTRGTRVIVTGRLEQRSWENQEGEKRSKIEIVADEVAPSIRFATVAITKNERRNPDGGGNSAGGGNYAGGTNSGGPAPAARPANNESPPAEYHYDEEPF
ncbi:MAG: single-stranded DNA-binding protein [Actinomycetota bacterium]|nr:single-stranded DNA-binding protein [Actinomycetota bacterium]